MSDLFRQEAVRRKKDSLYGAVMIKTPYGWGLLTTIAGTAAMVSLVMLGMANQPTSLTADGVIKVSDGNSRIVTQRAGIVKKLMVGNGQFVQRETDLIAVSIENSDMSGASPTAAIAKSLSAQEIHNDLQTEFVNARYLASSRAKSAKAKAVEAELVALKDREAGLYKLVTNAQQDYDQALLVARRGFLSRRDVANREEVLLSRKDAFSALQADMGSRRAELVQLKAELEAANSERLAAQQGLLVAKSDIAKMRMNNDFSQGYTLKSPRSGVVTNLEANVGDYVSAGQSILTVSPTKSEMTALIYLDDRTAPLVTVGNKVRLEFSAYPTNKFGFVTALITNVSLTPSPQGKSLTQIYTVTAKFDQAGNLQADKGMKLIDGLKFKAYIELPRPKFLSPYLTRMFGWYNG